MSYLFCPRAARPLLGLTVRAAPSRSTKAPSVEALRWLSHSVSSTRCSGFLIPAQRSTRPRCAPRLPVYACAGRRTFFSRRVMKKYEQLPADYQDQMGLAFRAEDLSQDEVDRVFPRGSISSIDANTLLRILHGRRVAGTLDDPAFAFNTNYFSEEHKSTALEYLRITVPVEEALNAGLRAEDELAQMDREAAARGKGGDASAAEAKTPELLYKPDPVYGASRFDEIRAKNEAKAEVREAAKKARQKAEEAEAEARAAKAGPVALINEEGKGIVNPRIAEYYKKAQEQGLEEPELVPFWQRILPSATFVVLAIGFLMAVTAVYEEPTANYRMLSGISTAQATVCTLIGVNALVYLGWRFPPLWSLFNRYMVFVVGAVKPVTLFTANFSHQSLSHLLINMVPLYFVGRALHDELDRASFLTLYAACGAMGYLGSLVTYTLRGWLSISSLGASGATLGIITAYFWEHKMDGFKFFGLPPDGVHGIVFLALLAAIQLSYFGKIVKSKVDLASHIAGMTTGVVGAEVIGWSRRRSLERQRQVTQGEAEQMSRVDGQSEGGEKAHIDVFGSVQQWVASFGSSKARGEGEEPPVIKSG